MPRLVVTACDEGEWETRGEYHTKDLRMEDDRGRSRVVRAYVYKSRLGPAWFWSVRVQPWAGASHPPLLNLPKTMADGKAFTLEAAQRDACAALSLYGKPRDEPPPAKPVEVSPPAQT